jgi:hypothetical protein
MKDLITFTGGLDFDSDIRNVGEVDYIDALNISSGTSQRGSVHNMYGNKLQNYTLPAGENTCIGTLRNIKQNSIIYFLYNSIGNHSILEYFCETKTIEPILVPFTLGSLVFDTSFLGFTKENKIHSANILDDILTWTDNNVSPRKINKKRAYDFIQQLPPSAINIPYNNLIATGTNNQKIQFIEFIKYKPLAEPFAGLGFNPDKLTNYIKNKMIQVKYRYIYDDNEYSRWSDGSWVTLPQGTETYLGINSNTVANNKVIVTLNTGHPTVKAIDVAFRFGNLGIWGKLDSPIQKYDQDNQRLIDDFINYEYDFYNDGVLIEIAEDFNNYDSVPQLSKTQEIIDGNRQVFANNVEGYQNPEPSVEINYNNSIVDLGIGVLALPARTFDPQKFTTSVVVFTDGGDPNNRGHLQNLPTGPLSIREQSICVPTNPSLVVVGTVVSFKLVLTTDPTFSITKEYDISYSIVANDLLNWPINIHTSLKDVIVSVANPAFIRTGTMTITISGVPTVVNYVSMQSEISSPWPDPPKQYAAIELLSVVKPIQKITSFKKGAWHSFGIVYKDLQGRDGGVLSNQTFNVYNPYLPEILTAQTTLNNTLAYQSRMDINIAHQPPAWAHEYEVVYALNNLKKYTQFVIKQNPDAAKNLTKADSHGNYSIDCSYIIDYITKERVVTSVDFQFEEGDYLRFISSSDYYATTYIECKVLAFDVTTNVLTVTGYSTAQITAGMILPTQEGTLCELFSYKNQAAQDNRPYFSIGQTYSISNPGTANRAHKANDQNQSGSTPAILRLNRGDCYIYRRYFKDGTIETVIESENFSDFYESKNIDISAVYAVIPEGKTKRYEQGLRYGGRYFPNTNTNDLCQFNGSDYDTVNTRYGPINKIATVGYTLKVLQTKKNTSIYIDRNMIFNANGDSQLTLTDKVLGNKNPSELDYGCDHPESVCVDDRHMYFFDVNTGAFIQDAPNGMMPISDYKAKTYFRNIAQKIKDTSNIYVYCSMDIFNAYINVTFIDTTGNIIPNQTIVYHTPDNKWKTKLSYTPEYYGSNALTFVSFKDGALWEHNDQTVARNNFYGIQYSTKVKFVANTDYLTIKNFASVAIYSSKIWSSPDIGDITIPASTGYPTGMASRLLPAKFRWKESVAYADYLRDANTPNFPTQEAALMGGRKLRGQVLVQEIENSDIDETVLYSVLITSVPSPLSK